MNITHNGIVRKKSFEYKNVANLLFVVFIVNLLKLIKHLYMNPPILVVLMLLVILLTLKKVL